LVFEGGGGGATQIGGASFGIGIDLEQFRRDLDTAERLSRGPWKAIASGLIRSASPHKCGLRTSRPHSSVRRWGRSKHHAQM
jgi:hypothetical protein